MHVGFKENRRTELFFGNISGNNSDNNIGKHILMSLSYSGFIVIFCLYWPFPLVIRHCHVGRVTGDINSDIKILEIAI